MTKRGNVIRARRPAPTNVETTGKELAPVRRTPMSLARRFVQICTTATAETLTGENLTPTQFAILVYLSRETGEPDIDQISLAERLGIDRARASQLVDELEAMNLLERRVNGADRRARLLRLTPRGETLRARLHPTQIASQMRVLAVLPPRKRELLLDLLLCVVESNRALARPGSGRRKRGFRRSVADKSRPSPSNKI
jgi:MarR family transcriptional regulator, lower aerobic nicotinate degradation pathway regulator